MRERPPVEPEDRDALREQEERFRTILEHAPVMIDSFDDDGTCVIWNRECVRRLGWTRDEINALDQPIAVFYPDPEELGRVLEDVARKDGEFREYQVLAKDGSVRTQMWANFRLPLGSTISVGHDVTEQRAMEMQLRQSQKMEALGQLTGGIAHDFNNLLTVIVASADLLLRAGTSGELGEQLAQQIRQAANDGAELVRQLMTFAGQRRLEVQPVDLPALVDGLLPTLRRILPESIEVTVERSPDPLVISADRVAIEQVLVNLATNARDAIDTRGTITLSSRLARPRHRGEHAREHAVLAVRDTGAGMRPEVRDRVFEPFFTTKAAGRGTGLGLPTVYGLVEEHGGFVELASEPGRGTVVEVWIPTIEGRPAVPSRDDPEEAELPRGTETILVVEDDAATRTAARQALELLGYVVRSAEDGVAALAALDADPAVDLILSDVVMPRMTGPELFERLAAREGRGPALAFWTGYAPSKGDRRWSHHHPMIEKPWSLASLATFVRRCLDEAGAATE